MSRKHLAAALVTTALALVAAGAAAADTLYHATGPAPYVFCSDAVFPQADFMGPGNGGANALEEADAADIVAGGGTFWVAATADRSTDIYAVGWGNTAPGVGDPATDGQPYVAVGRYGLALGACPPAQAEDSIFLCYSKFQVDPGVWTASEAAKLQALGYWRPYAVKGTGTATRLGGYSLVCNLSGSQKPAGQSIDGVGTLVSDPALTRYAVAA